MYWAAGIYEGEGTVGISRKPRWCTFALSVTQKDPEILYKLQRLFGGSVRSKLKHDGCYVWYAAGVRARGIAMTLYSLLSTRRKGQLKNAIERWKAGTDNGIRNSAGRNQYSKGRETKSGVKDS